MTGVYDFLPRGALKVLFALMKPVIAGNVAAGPSKRRGVGAACI